MLGKTHMVIGIAATLAVTDPRTLTGMVLAIGGGAIGALISDIDVSSSASHREADRIIALAIGMALGVLVMDKFLHTGIIAAVLKDSGKLRCLIGIVLFIVICAFGKEQPHRSFMHSFLALILLSFSVGLVWEEIVPYFAVGFLSHLITDLFNKKKMKLFYPLKSGVCFGLCYAQGAANNTLFTLGCVVSLAEAALFTARIIL